MDRGDVEDNGMVTSHPDFFCTFSIEGASDNYALVIRKATHANSSFAERIAGERREFSMGKDTLDDNREVGTQP